MAPRGHETAGSGAIAVSTSNLFIGSKASGEWSLRGYLAEVMVWSRRFINRGGGDALLFSPYSDAEGRNKSL